MVQLQNPDRLNLKIVFGTLSTGLDDDGFQITDDNGLPTESFKRIGKPTLCGRWQLTTTQTIQMTGLNQNNSFIVVVHHRQDWNGITHAQLNNVVYEISNISADPFQNPTAYDLITLTKVSERND